MVIVNMKAGRLANRLIHLSHFIANARAYQYPLIYPYFNEYKRFFPALQSDQLEENRIRLSIVSHDFSDRLLCKGIKAISLLSETLLPETRFYKFHQIRKRDREKTRFDLNDHEYVKAAQTKVVFADGWGYRDSVHFWQDTP
ncbi:MAG: hypothetical protein HQ542_05210, partial [Bacteroidia bacterium]|nr:hypothetical protein [Bacteroidia bacterium]